MPTHTPTAISPMPIRSCRGCSATSTARRRRKFVETTPTAPDRGIGLRARRALLAGESANRTDVKRYLHRKRRSDLGTPVVSPSSAGPTARRCTSSWCSTISPIPGSPRSAIARYSRTRRSHHPGRSNNGVFDCQRQVLRNAGLHARRAARHGDTRSHAQWNDYGRGASFRTRAMKARRARWRREAPHPAGRRGDLRAANDVRRARQTPACRSSSYQRVEDVSERKARGRGAAAVEQILRATYSARPASDRHLGAPDLRICK